MTRRMANELGCEPLSHASPTAYVTSEMKYGIIARKSMTFIMSRKNATWSGQDAKRISSSRANQTMHAVSRIKNGSLNDIRSSISKRPSDASSTAVVQVDPDGVVVVVSLSKSESTTSSELVDVSFTMRIRRNCGRVSTQKMTIDSSMTTMDVIAINLAASELSGYSTSNQTRF